MIEGLSGTSTSKVKMTTDRAPTTLQQFRRYGPPALLSLAALLFVGQNTEGTSFNFLWFEFDWPRRPISVGSDTSPGWRNGKTRGA
jgi:uncharacterized integral membrane protein